METILSIAEGVSGRLVAVGNNGVIYVSDDRGATWASRTSGVQNHLHCVAFGSMFNNDRWIAAGQAGIILSSADDGDTWVVETSPSGGDWYGLAFQEIFYLVGAQGSFALSADLGATWVMLPTPTTEDLYSISLDASLYVIIGANDTVIVGNIETTSRDVFVFERATLSSPLASTGTFRHETSEALEAVAGYAWNHIDGSTSEETASGEIQHVFLSDGINAFDAETDTSGGFNLVVDEELATLGHLIGSSGLRSLVQETITAQGAATLTYAHVVSTLESLLVSPELTSQEAVLVKEVLLALSRPSENGAFNHAITQGVSLRASVLLSWLLMASEHITLDDAAFRDPTFLAEIVERVTASGIMSSRLEAVAAVALTVVLQEVFSSGKGFEILEGVEISQAVFDQARFLAVQIEQALLDTPAEGALRVSVPATDRVNLDTVFSASGLLQAALKDGLSFQISFGLDGQTYSGWVLNTKNFAVTEYQNYPFNSFAKIGAHYFGANDSGLYRLDGDTDAGAPIEAAAKLGITDFGTDYRKRLDSIFLGFRTDGSILIKTLTEENVERWYEVTGAIEKLHTKRVHPLAKALTSTYWQTEIRNIDGADFEIDSIKFVPVILSRRV